MKIKVRPINTTIIVFDGNGKPIPYKQDGVYVEKSLYVLRRINEGDLEKIEEKKGKGDSK